MPPSLSCAHAHPHAGTPPCRWLWMCRAPPRASPSSTSPRFRSHWSASCTSGASGALYAAQPRPCSRAGLLSLPACRAAGPACSIWDGGAAHASNSPPAACQWQSRTHLLPPPALPRRTSQPATALQPTTNPPPTLLPRLPQAPGQRVCAGHQRSGHAFHVCVHGRAHAGTAGGVERGGAGRHRAARRGGRLLLVGGGVAPLVWWQ